MNSLEQIVAAIRLRGFTVVAIPHMSYSLEHSYTKEEFQTIIKDVLEQFEVIPQDEDWYPGSPTNDPDHWGFYIRPQYMDLWEEGDFDMAIHFDGIYWC